MKATFRKMAAKVFGAILTRPSVDGWIRQTMPPSQLTSLILHNKDNREAPFRAFSIFCYLQHLLRRSNRRPKRILEIGPGVNLGALFCFASDDTVERTVGLDVAPLKEDARYYHRLHRFLASTCYFSWWRPAMQRRGDNTYPNSVKAGNSSGVYQKLEYYVPFTAADLPFEPESFDLIYSVSVLEHVDEPEKAVAEMKRCLSPGGVMIHSIDMAYHEDYSRPLEFLKWSEVEYQRRVLKYGGNQGLGRILDGAWREGVFCNRLRMSDWEALFRSHGLKIRDTIVISILDEDKVAKTEFAAPFRDKELADLRVLSAWVVLERG